jgi:amino acid transporter
MNLREMLNQQQQHLPELVILLQTGFNHCYFSGYLMLVVLMGQSRVFYTMSKDGLLHSLVTFTQNSEHHGKQIFSGI